MKSIRILLLLLFPIAVCSQSIGNNSKNDYQLVPDNDGILVEKFDSINVDENKYNTNNSVFKPGTSFKYAFEHLTAAGEQLYFKVNSDQKSWDFVAVDKADSRTIKSVVIQVMAGNPMAQYVPDYNQTTIAYIFLEGEPFSMSGVIENEANVWAHPPRDHYFKILELNPFPYIKAPYAVGTEWTWNLKIGSKWGDQRWKTWDGNIDNTYNYKITDKAVIKTPLGELECLVIESTAASEIGTTELVAYFHPKYGFVKLNYTNIDGSKTNLVLTEYIENEMGG
ncbi:hypothetical protein [Robiginitalea sp. SC105]|uniref:hypothetical protein n=1 Tax=Robiginitalea sp. SC105 TaxID=2762332 RepID=UPI00163A2D00|nr:hypothetical protein [Robiginitalea sp. SC105]MBC2839729.1 hypothetical protein [Robiginitalea sp. SC105]